jgi:SAM-dependent methyltransferase
MLTGSESHSSYDPAYFQPLFAIEDRHFWFQARNRAIATCLMEAQKGMGVLLNRFVQRFVEHPRVYDQIQSFVGLQKIQQRLAPYLGATGLKSVLDVGAGTGLYLNLLPKMAHYIGLDLDLPRLRKLSQRRDGGQAVLGDATLLCLANQSIDVVLCVCMSHHLTDQQLPRLFEELARVTKEQVIFLDPVSDTGIRGRLLWKYDRGGYPRSTETLLREFEKHWEIEQVERFTIHHHYLLCVGRPKPSILVRANGS